jgi:hypothetical protein
MQQAWRNAKKKKPKPVTKPVTQPVTRPRPQRRRDQRRGHTVSQGEDLLTIAKKYGTSPEDIARANRGVLQYRAGINIKIPGPPGRTRKPGAPGQFNIGDLPQIGGGFNSSTPNASNVPPQLPQIRPDRPQIDFPSSPLSSRIPTQSTSITDFRRYGYENELIYQKQLVKSEENIRVYNQYPDYLSSRMAGSLGFNTQDLLDLGYVKDGNYWVATEQIGGLPDAAGAGPAGGSTGGYAPARGYGGYGGGGGGGGGSAQKERLPYYALESGMPAYSQSGRMFDVGSLGLIHWRLG